MKEEDPSHDITASVPVMDPLSSASLEAYTESLRDQFFGLFPDTEPRGQSDRAFFRELVVDFGNEVDLIEESKRFHAWSLDNASENARNLRGRFRDWMNRTRIYRRAALTKKEKKRDAH